MRRRIPFLFLFLFALIQSAGAHLGGSTVEAGQRKVAVMDRGETVPAQMTAGSRKQASRLLLEFRFREIRSRIDSLWEDSLRVAPEELPRFRRAMHTAAKVLAEAEGRLDDLRRSESEAEIRKWENLRARMERTIFGLNRYLADTEAYWLPARIPGALPVGNGREGDL